MNWFRSEMCVAFSLQLSVAFSILRYDLHFIKIEFFSIIAIVTSDALRFAEGKREIDLIPKSAFSIATCDTHQPASSKLQKRLQFG